uniref:Retrovirus-related Pol polyprotein from transposon TNT 1-94 n=1 Tax=Tanacetum cinerariifolium TaxID=118510 RepID=A0A6L2KCM8_TANCI|nr:hypothetical protein [Tanacetum cinerariifolium]
MKSQVKDLFNEDAWIGVEDPISTDEEVDERTLSNISFGDRMAYKFYVIEKCQHRETRTKFEVGLEVDSIRRIQGIGYGVLEFLGVQTTLDIFQNIIFQYFQYGVLVFTEYVVLSMFPLWSLVSVGTYFLDGYGVLDFQDSSKDEEDIRSSESSSKSIQVKNKGLVVEAYEWDQEDVLLDENKKVEVKVLMALVDDEKIVVVMESARTSEWVQISIKRINLMVKHRDIVLKLNM